MISDLLVFHKIKARLGGRVRLIVTGGAPIPAHVEEFLKVTMCAPVVQVSARSPCLQAGALKTDAASEPTAKVRQRVVCVLCVVCMQGYGLTESCAASFIQFPYDVQQDFTVGPPMPQVRAQLRAPLPTFRCGVACTCTAPPPSSLLLAACTRCTPAHLAACFLRFPREAVPLGASDACGCVLMHVQTELRLEAVPDLGYSPTSDPPRGEVRPAVPCTPQRLWLRRTRRSGAPADEIWNHTRYLVACCRCA